MGTCVFCHRVHSGDLHITVLFREQADTSRFILYNSTIVKHQVPKI